MKNFIGRILERLKYLKISDIKHIFLFFCAVPISFIFRLFHKNLWLICEDGSSARDNGYWLFKYICENQKNVDVTYAITKKSPDRNKVLKYGNVVTFATLKHWIYYISAKYNIFSAKLGKPSPAVCFPLEQIGILKNKKIFLQHGIIKDDMKSLYYDVCKFSLFSTSAFREYEFVENTFGYKGKNIVKLLGLTRFDNLYSKIGYCNKKQILIMPTWRDWLGNASLHLSFEKFKKSEYFVQYQSLLNDSIFQTFLIENNLRLIFFPHKGMQKFRECFSSNCKNIIIADWNKYDIQQLLIDSAICVTDYSSIAMDFAYMLKPLIYFQFDYDKFRTSHYGEGYFSYTKDGFGDICKRKDDVVCLIKKYYENDFKIKDKYLDRIKDFFTLHDNKNCYRTFEAIKNLSL